MRQTRIDPPRVLRADRPATRLIRSPDKSGWPWSETKAEARPAGPLHAAWREALRAYPGLARQLIALSDMLEEA